MDRSVRRNVNFRNVVRFGYFMAVGAERGDALHALFERARPMLVPAGRPGN